MEFLPQSSMSFLPRQTHLSWEKELILSLQAWASGIVSVGLGLWYEVATVSSSGFSKLNGSNSSWTPGISLLLLHPPKYTCCVFEDQDEAFNSIAADEIANKNKQINKPKQSIASKHSWYWQTSRLDYSGFHSYYLYS